MQIAIARMKNIADAQAIALADFSNKAQRGRHARARNHAILHVI